MNRWPAIQRTRTMMSHANPCLMSLRPARLAPFVLRVVRHVRRSAPALFGGCAVCHSRCSFPCLCPYTPSRDILLRACSTKPGGGAMDARSLKLMSALAVSLAVAACSGSTGSATDTTKAPPGAATPANDAAVRAMIDSADRKFEAAFKAGDAAAAASFYEENAT